MKISALCRSEVVSNGAMKYVFGPVLSRRLGRSLGVDTVPQKTCNWNCVYCQLGRSCPLTNQRKRYYPIHEIVNEVRHTLVKYGSEQIDWLSLVASGEGTLHSHIGLLIRQLKATTYLPIAAITNGSLLYRQDVREALCPADAVLPSLNAGSERIHCLINRPHPSLTFVRHIEGLIAFRRQYTGKLWIEVMLIGGLNDSEKALWDIAAALERIDPDEVHLMLPSRPPAEHWVRPPDTAGLERAQSILGGIVRLVPAGGPCSVPLAPRAAADTVLSIVRRHPMTQSQLEAELDGWAPDEINDALHKLKIEGMIQPVRRFGVPFWCDASMRYGDTESPTEHATTKPIGGSADRKPRDSLMDRSDKPGNLERPSDSPIARDSL